MIAALTGLGSTIANSRPMQYAIGAGLLILGFLAWLAAHDRALLKAERLRQKQKSLEKDQAIRENSDEAVEAADTIRANTERISSARMPDEDLSSYHYRD